MNVIQSSFSLSERGVPEKNIALAMSSTGWQLRKREIFVRGLHLSSITLISVSAAVDEPIVVSLSANNGVAGCTFM